jgi:hypothetical protein
MLISPLAGMGGIWRIMFDTHANGCIMSMSRGANRTLKIYHTNPAQPARRNFRQGETPDTRGEGAENAPRQAEMPQRAYGASTAECGADEANKWRDYDGE